MLSACSESSGCPACKCSGHGTATRVGCSCACDAGRMSTSEGGCQTLQAMHAPALQLMLRGVEQGFDCGTPNCNGHGAAVQGGCSCTCDAGWTTSTNQDLAHYVFCNSQSSSVSGEAACRLGLRLLAQQCCFCRLAGCAVEHCCLPVVGTEACFCRPC